MHVYFKIKDYETKEEVPGDYEAEFYDDYDNATNSQAAGKIPRFYLTFIFFHLLLLRVSGSVLRLNQVLRDTYRVK